MSKKRDINSIKVRGLNSVDNINIVDDGWCETLHNVSFRDGVVASVAPHGKDAVLLESDYSVRYIHPVLPKGEYIAVYGLDVAHVKVIDGTLFPIKNILSLEFGTDMDGIKFSHFGDILHIHYGVGGTEYYKAFVYRNNEYSPNHTNNLREITAPEITLQYFKPAKLNDSDPAMNVLTVHTELIEGSDKRSVINIDKNYENIYADITKANYLYGAIYLMFAIRVNDGSIMYNSKIYMLNGEYDNNNEKHTLYKKYKTDVPEIQYNFYKDIYGFLPTIKFVGLDELKNNTDVKSIIIYSTRNNPIHNFDNVYYDFVESEQSSVDNITTCKGSSSCVLDKRNADIANTPFYAITEVDFRVKNSITLGANDCYAEIETKPIFSPSVSPHNYLSKGSINLNGRQHMFNIMAQLYPSAPQVYNFPEIIIGGATYKRYEAGPNSDLFEICIAVTINVSGRKHTVNSFNKGFFYSKDGGYERFIVIPNMFSYQDIRAEKMDIFISRIIGGEKKYSLIKSVNLKPAAANNYAFYYNTGGDALMYCELIKYSLFTENDYKPVLNESTCRFPNRIMVSEYNKPYQYYPEHIYYVGDNITTQIVDVNTPVDQLTESRFGQYPVYLFTTSGIYAMEQGVDNVLYQNIIKINNDIALDGSNTIGAERALFYFTNHGLMCLNGGLSTVVSEKQSSDLNAFFSGAEIYYIPRYRELFITNKLFDFAYIYSLGSGFWTTRDFKGKMISLTKYIYNNTIYDIMDAEESAEPLQSFIVTRELSLGSRQFKKIEVMLIDIMTNNDFTVTLLASADGVKWFELMKSENSGYLRRSSSSWRWFKVKIEGIGFQLDTLHFESFIRFARHIK